MVVRGTFHRFDAWLAAKWSDARVRFRLRTPFRTLARSAKSVSPPRHGSGPPHCACRSLPEAFQRSQSRNEMLLTDFCNQRSIHAPAKRSIPERGAFAATDRSLRQ
jgi:hypothetical protein